MITVLVAFAAKAAIITTALLRLTTQQKPAPSWAADAGPLGINADILKRRYANGQLGRDEYPQRFSAVPLAAASRRPRAMNAGSVSPARAPERTARPASTRIVP